MICSLTKGLMYICLKFYDRHHTFYDFVQLPISFSSHLHFKIYSLFFSITTSPMETLLVSFGRQFTDSPLTLLKLCEPNSPGVDHKVFVFPSAESYSFHYYYVSLSSRHPLIHPGTTDLFFNLKGDHVTFWKPPEINSFTIFGQIQKFSREINVALLFCPPSILVSGPRLNDPKVHFPFSPKGSYHHHSTLFHLPNPCIRLLRQLLKTTT